MASIALRVKFTHTIFLIIALQTIIFMPVFVYPQSNKNSINNLTTENFVEIEGLIVDETRTKIGRDFYDIFYNKWTAPANAKDFTITISEKPMPRLGALVSIKINDMDVFSGFVQPRWEAIEESAVAGIHRVRSYLENWEMIQSELQGEDMKGSGIF